MRRPGGKYFESSVSRARTASAVASALAPAASWTPMPAGGLTVVLVVDVEVLGAELDARDVAQPNLRAVRIHLEQDAAEVFGRAQERRLGDRGCQALRGRRRSAAELPAGDLHVLTLQRVRDVDRRERESVELVRIEPDAHRVLGAEHVDVADAADAAHRILDVGDDVVGDVVLRHVRVGGHERRDQQERCARLGHTNPRLLYLRRQQRCRQLQLVLDLHLRDVRIRAGLEGQRGRGLAGVVARGGQVQQVIDPAHLLLDHLDDRVLDGRRRGAGITRRDLDRRRCDRRILLDGQSRDRQRAREHDQNRDDDRKDRPGDEEPRHDATPRQRHARACPVALAERRRR